MGGRGLIGVEYCMRIEQGSLSSYESQCEENLLVAMQKGETKREREKDKLEV